MAMPRLLSLGLTALLATPAAAQLTAVPHSGERSIIVTGERLKGAAPAAHVAMSDWRVAETDHVLVFSKGDPRQLARIAGNLEKLHFLLSILLNRVDQPDQTLKLSVTMIGDPADYDHLGLRNTRWQQGPYPNEFPNQIYYDPREDGAVMATAHADQCFAVVRDASVVTGEELLDNPGAIQTPADLANAASSLAGSSRSSGDHCAGNPNKVSVTAEGRLYSAFAQHFLMTYFPVAYPRWYLEGFGEIFANMDADTPGVIEYGNYPDQYRKVIDKFGHYPVQKVLDGTYLTDKRWFPAFSPYSAWALAHLLFFSDEWRAPLHNYLASFAKGESDAQAQAAFGDTRKLSRELAAYFGRNVHFERVTYPAGQFAPPLIRRLKQSEAVYVGGRLVLGARVTIPNAATAKPGQSPANVEDARQKALASRDTWLAGLRDNAAKYPDELADQQLLAEAECRSGNPDRCIAAADRALSISANDPVATNWKGYGLALHAVAGPASERTARLAEARATIIRANRLDTESVLPLLAFYRSYAVAGDTPPDIAVDGLAKSLDEVPSAPTTRLLLGSALVVRSDAADARRIILPVAAGAFDPPEKQPAKQLLTSLTSGTPSGASTGTH